jgi:hypothetical protein
MSEATARNGQTKQEVIEKFCEEYARERGIKIRRAPRRSGGDNTLS